MRSEASRAAISVGITIAEKGKGQMQKKMTRVYVSWLARFAVLLLVLGLGFVIGDFRKSVGAADSGPDMAMIKNSADIVQIYNLEAHYANALDSGRLGDVADLWTPNGGFAEYYQDPVTTHLVNLGHPVGMNEQPITDFPSKGEAACLVFGRENLIHYFHEGGNSVRPHVPGWPGGVGEYPGKTVVRHAASTMWVEVKNGRGTLYDYYAGTQITAESIVVRTPAGWRFLFKKVISPKPSNLSCHIYDTKFPIPSAESLGVSPNLVNPD